MFQFYTPWFLVLLPLPLLFWIIKIRRSKATANLTPEIIFPAVKRLKEAFGSSTILRNKRNTLFGVLLTVLWVSLVLALMQPERVEKFTQSKNIGYDLMLAVDISASMQAVDFSTSTKTISRIDATKEVVGKFVKGRQGDRVGLVTFGQHAYLHVPLTLDTMSVNHMLQDATPGMAGNATAIGDAIGISIKTLRERPEGSRVIVLLTDGADNSSSLPPLEAAKLAKQYGIRIYVVGVGKNGLAPFPNRFGGQALMEVTIDEKLLKEIADITGGQYFQASDQRALESIYTKINQLEKTESNEMTYYVREPYFRYPLALAAFCLVALALLTLLSQSLNRRAST